MKVKKNMLEQSEQDCCRCGGPTEGGVVKTPGQKLCWFCVEHERLNKLPLNRKACYRCGSTDELTTMYSGRSICQDCLDRPAEDEMPGTYPRE